MDGWIALKLQFSSLFAQEVRFAMLLLAPIDFKFHALYKHTFTHEIKVGGNVRQMRSEQFYLCFSSFSHLWPPSEGVLEY